MALSFFLAPVARAQSSWTAGIERFEVPADCGSPETFAARLDALGAAPGSARLAVEIAPSWSGLVRGVVVVTRAHGAPVERAIEDDVCADVLDALAIAAALALRSPAVAIAPPDPPIEVTPEPLPEPEPITPTPAPPPRVRVALGAGLRAGLGPVPGLALAPDVSIAVDVEYFFASIHVLAWPESAAPTGAGAPSQPGVALYALGSTLEVGGRLGNDVAIVPAAVLELSAVVARGIGLEQPRTEVAFACDAGASFALHVDLAPVRLFARVDALFAVTQPTYLVGSTTAYETPIVRGTGMLGISYVFGSP